jgi:hypothetical protein
VISLPELNVLFLLHFYCEKLIGVNLHRTVSTIILEPPPDIYMIETCSG